MMIRKKTGPGRPEKRTSYGKGDSAGKRAVFGKTEGSKSDKTGKRATYGKKEDKRAERRLPSTLERKPGWAENKPASSKGSGTSARREKTFRERRPAPPKSFAIVKSEEPAAREVREEISSAIIYGVNPVLEAFRAGRGIEKLVLAEKRSGKEVTEIINLARGKNIKMSFEPRESLSRISRTENHQGVLAIVAAGRYSTLEEILKKAKGSGESPFLLILDGIQDPQNLGAIIRSAVCSGVHGVIIPKDRAVGLTSTVDKASAGAMEYMPVVKVTNIAQTLDALKKEGLWIIGTEGEAKANLYSADFKGAIGLVIGSEGEGIRPLVAKKCDILVSIPIKGRVSSLNASAAAAVVMYEVVRQRGTAPSPSGRGKG